MSEEMKGIAQLLGKTLISIKFCGEENSGEWKYADRILFTTEDNEVYEMFHIQDCCENVYLEDLVGNVEDLIGSPIVVAHESSSATRDTMPDGMYTYVDNSITWTFYHLATAKGWVTLRWFGTSNGYYSESVDFVKL